MQDHLIPINSQQAECRHWQLQDSAVRVRSLWGQVVRTDTRALLIVAESEYKKQARREGCECGYCDPGAKPRGPDEDNGTPDRVNGRPVHCDVDGKPL